MKKNIFILVLFTFVFVLQISISVSGAMQALNPVDEISMSRSQYITGGILGSAFGFGIGHAIQGRYVDKGWIFTASDVSGYLLLANANCFRGRDTNSPDRAVRERSDCKNVGQGILGAGLIIGSRVLQVLDLWIGGKNFVRNDPSESQLLILPGDQQGTLVYAVSFLIVRAFF